MPEEKKKKFNPASVPFYFLEQENNGLTQKQELAVWQHGVDTGQIWHLQGWYGRTAQDLINQGLIDYSKKKTYDYYGNPIPTRARTKKKMKDST